MIFSLAGQSELCEKLLYSGANGLENVATDLIKKGTFLSH